MKKNELLIIKEPSAEDYFQLLDFVFQRSKTFLLVTRPTINLSPIGQNLLTKLSGNILTKIETSQWPGTQLLESKATAFTFRADNFSKEVLKSATSGLFSWVQPELPEDLCFSYDDGSELMTTVTHEKIAYLHLNDNDKNLILKNCPQIFK